LIKKRKNDEQLQKENDEMNSPSIGCTQSQIASRASRDDLRFGSEMNKSDIVSRNEDLAHLEMDA